MVLTVLKENNGLFGRVGGWQKFELFPETETKYFIKEFLARGLTFIKNDRGKVIKVLIHTDWGDLIAKKIK
jgi:hypothetical protein